MIIDTHCHLTGDFCDANDLDAVIKRAIDAGVTTLVVSSADPGEATDTLALAEKYDGVYCTLGVHPENGNLAIKDLSQYLPDELFEHPKVVGVGETGLDYHYGDEFKREQAELFEKHIDIARRHNLPLVIHSRDAADDTIAMLDGSVPGVMHCFSYDWDVARAMLDRGFYFSASGVLTYKNADELRDVFTKIPNDRIVIETDAPFLAPVPYRGKKCEPFMTCETAKTMAAIKNLPLDEMISILANNTKNLYKKIKI